MQRRAFIASSLALAACSPAAQGQPPLAIPPLKSVAPFPVGTAVQAAQLDDPALAALVAAQVSQLTPEWELKMEYVLQPDGGYRFDAPDRIAAFCADQALRLFGHTLVWYAQKPDFFAGLARGTDRSAFRDAFAAYITAVVGRYQGRMRRLGRRQRSGDRGRRGLARQPVEPGARTAGAHAPRLRAGPRGRSRRGAVPQRLQSREQSEEAGRVPEARRGAAEGRRAAVGLGTQTHVAADLAPGAITAAVKDLASLGLKVRISEMDVSLARAQGVVNARADLQRRQSALFAEAAEAFAALPAHQRFDFTFWGLEDRSPG